MTDQVRQTLTIEAPSERVWEVITDFPAYPEWTDHMTRAEVVERDADDRAIRVAFTVDARVAVIDYVLAYEYGTDRMDWHLAESDLLRTLDGTYVVEPLGSARCRVSYSLEGAIALPVPGFLRRRAIRVIQEMSLEGLARRATTDMAA